MKFAFSTNNFPQWDLAKAAGKARELGYDGLEVSEVIDVEQSGREALGSVEICCLDSAVEFSGERKIDEEAAIALRWVIDTAAGVGSANVKLRAARIELGVNPSSALVGFGDWLKPMGEYAREKGVNILVSNEGGLESARQIWAVLDRLGQSSVGCCWDAAEGMVRGERAAIAVPMLNSRIRMVQITDAMSEVVVEDLIHRLRGIGYDGFVAVEIRAAEEAVEIKRPAHKRSRGRRSAEMTPPKFEPVKVPTAATAASQLQAERRNAMAEESLREWIGKLRGWDRRWEPAAGKVGAGREKTPVAGTGV